jgi:hypothetical protein
MKNSLICYVTPYGCCKNRRFGRTLRSVLRLLVTAHVRSSLILVTLMTEAIRSSESPFLTIVTRVTSQKTAVVTAVKTSSFT